MKLRNGTTWEEFLADNEFDDVYIDDEGYVKQVGNDFSCGSIYKENKIEEKTYYSTWDLR